MAVSGVIVQQALLHQSLALEAIKQQTQAQQTLANVVQQTAEAAFAPTTTGRGQQVDLLV